jgi:hypothetical protein
MNNAIETQSYSQNTQSSAFPSFISPGLVKFLLLFPVLLTAVYAKSYTGEYQLLINNHIVGVFYVLFGSLFISTIFQRMKFWKSVAFSFSIVSILEVLQLFRLPFMVDLTRRSLFSFLFGTTFDPGDFVFYGIGAVLGLLSLWLLDASKWQKYTEVY